MKKIDKCPKCHEPVDPTEIYSDWYHCEHCESDFDLPHPADENPGESVSPGLCKAALH